MADTFYPTNHPVAVKFWYRKLFREALKQCWISKFMGRDSGSAIQILGQTEKGPGDLIRIPLRMQLLGPGVQGDGILEGQEEELAVYTCDVRIDQLRHAVRSGGRMSDQRIPFSVREEAFMGLKDWWTDRLDFWGINQLTGNSGVTDTRFTGNQAVTAPTATKWLVAGSAGNGTQANENALSNTATNLFNLGLIDTIVARAKTFNQPDVPIRPIKVNGEDKYVMIIHPYQHIQLRAGTSAGQYLDIQKAALTGGQISKNPIYTGAIAEYNGVVLHEDARIPVPTSSTNANARRAVFFGAQAAAFCYGQDSSGGEIMWREELFDFKNRLGVAAGMISGLLKLTFNSSDFGTIAVSSFSPAV